MTTVLTLRDLTRIHLDGGGDVIALADVDLNVEPGELVAVTGRSGCGKSTLLNLAGGLDQPTRGSVTVVGQELRRRGVAGRAQPPTPPVPLLTHPRSEIGL